MVRSPRRILRARWALGCAAVVALNAPIVGVESAHVAGASAATAADVVRCFGAAERDPLNQPCHNPALRYEVQPTPSEAELLPNAPCERVRREGLVHPCAFGTPADEAVGTIALIGDSHASHWRAAVEVVARAQRWAGMSVTNGICPVSTAIKRHGDPAVCRRWNRDVLRWLANHPEVTTVFQSQIISRKGVYGHHGRGVFPAEVAGYRRVWRKLPRSVKHIIVIRDNPKVPSGNFDCVMRARARRRPPGPTCAVSRHYSLRRDPEAVAAARSRLSRVELVDLTPFFCDKRLCFPVVGGVLVHKDAHHLTRLYAGTLGPFLDRAVRRLMDGWTP
jgi:SGNH domain-containing protein